MDDNSSNFDTSPGNSSGSGGKPPFKLNLQMVATGVLLLALLAVLWLFFAPQPQPETTMEPTPTPPTAMTAVAQPALGGTVAAMSSPGAVGSVVAPALGGTPGLGTPGLGTTMAPAAGLGTAGAPGPGTPTVAAMSGGALAAGQFTSVGGSDGLGIRLRFGPGSTYNTIRIVMDGEVLKVLNGPETAEGAAWWRVQDAEGNIGWAAEEYLKPASAPANWAPPAASPTFPPRAPDAAGAIDEATATP